MTNARTGTNVIMQFNNPLDNELFIVAHRHAHRGANKFWPNDLKTLFIIVESDFFYFVFRYTDLQQLTIYIHDIRLKNQNRLPLPLKYKYYFIMPTPREPDYRNEKCVMYYAMHPIAILCKQCANLYGVR